MITDLVSWASPILPKGQDTFNVNEWLRRGVKLNGRTKMCSVPNGNGNKFKFSANNVDALFEIEVIRRTDWIMFLILWAI